MEIVSHIQQEAGPDNKVTRSKALREGIKRHYTYCCVQSEVLQRLECLGHRVGESLVERASRDHPRFKNELDAVVFMCKQFWMLAFNKNIDNLKTNHQVKAVLICLLLCDRVFVCVGYICTP